MNTHTTTRYKLPVWAWLPLGMAILAETISNGLRAYALGTHLDRFTFEAYGHAISLAGLVLVLAAGAVSLVQTRAFWLALTPGPLSRRLGGGLIGALLLAVSGVAMASHVIEAQRTKVADEGGARGAYDRAETAYKAAAAEMEALGTPRPVSVIQAEVSAFKIDDAIWRRSKKCEDISREDTKEACKPILDLYKERGAAARKAELEPEVAKLRDALAKMQRPEVVSEAEGTLNFIWACLLAVGVISIATFGMVILARVETVEAPAPVAVTEPVKAITETPKGQITDEEIEEVAKVLRRLKVLTNQELADKLSISKGEASKRVAKAVEAGVIAKRREGREVFLSLATH